eukprot:5767219-Prymnesium_polylepis.2
MGNNIDEEAWYHPLPHRQSTHLTLDLDESPLHDRPQHAAPVHLLRLFLLLAILPDHAQTHHGHHRGGRERDSLGDVPPTALRRTRHP